jgi:HD-GYP domain-containing protein (c-di-GMP phosphodiesterase class II)
MNTRATGEKPSVSTALRTMPAVIAIEGDDVAFRALKGIQRYARLKLADLEGRDAETIVLVSSERLLSQLQTSLRAPNVRVIALSDKRFADPRMDGAVYGYLPPTTPPNLVERMLDNALDHIHLLQTRREINERLAGATKEISELNAIGAALSAEHDTEKLLELILTKSREITRSDAGSLYLVEETTKEPEAPVLDPALPEPGGTAEEPAVQPEPALEFGGAKLVVSREANAKKLMRFKLAQNDTVTIPFRERVMEISDQSISGYVVKTGEIVNLEDAYHLPDLVPYSFNRKIDESSGYRTKSMLTVPMRNQKGDIVGVVQLINAKRRWDSKLNSLSQVVNEVVAFNIRQQEMVTSLASQAAVALENSRLYEAIQRLFEGFVKASVTAIESRDPTTSGHSFRVANLTVALAETVDRATDGMYQGIRFTRDQMKEIRYASLLHDFGKVGVREEVLVKAKKLYPAQLELIKQRFHFVKRSMQVESLQNKLDYVLEKGREEYLARVGEFDDGIADQLREVDAYFATVLQSNEPTVLPEGNFERLTDISARHFLDFDGADEALLNPDEVRLLSIRKGSLDESERLQIESHVVHTFNFLNQIPWTKEIRNIPEIARSHHEKLTGKGYPSKLNGPDIPLQTRMMTISDIFDALAASDRPYKRAVPVEKAVQILEMEVKDGNLDENLFRLFVDAKMWDRWKVEPFPY